jgi:type IV secretory pathway VirB6-like protein
MLKRILLVRFTANFALAGLFALFSGGWYLRLPVFVGMMVELGPIIVPNLLFPILLMRYG